MLVGGMCPWTPKQDDRTAMARKVTSMHESGRASGPAHPKLREGVMRNVRKVSDQMIYKTSYGSKLQNRP